MLIELLPTVILPGFIEHSENSSKWTKHPPLGESKFKNIKPSFKQEAFVRLKNSKGEQSMVEEDLVNYPFHYTFGKYEVLDVLDDWKLGPYEFLILQYIARSDHKGNKLQDLKKAQFYLNRLIKNIEANNEQEK
jgi:hypothetical protein